MNIIPTETADGESQSPEYPIPSTSLAATAPSPERRCCCGGTNLSVLCPGFSPSDRVQHIVHVELRCLPSLLMSFLPGSVILQCVCADELEFLSLQIFKLPLRSSASKALFLCFSPPGCRFFSSSSFSPLSLTRVLSGWVCLGRRWPKEFLQWSKRGIYDPSPRSMMLVMRAPHALFSLGAVQGRARAGAAEEPGPQL